MKSVKKCFTLYRVFLIFVIVLIALALTSSNLHLQKNSVSAIETVKEQSTSKVRNLTDFNFSVAGDFGCGPKANQTVSNMAAKKPELVIALGDLSYQKDASCWFNTVAPLDSKGILKIAIGEHDVDENLTKYKNYLQHFNLTNPYYSFDYQNVHFLAMATAKNSVVPYNSTSKQFEFVKDDLTAAHKNKNINWIIVYTFRPFYSSNTTHPGLDKLQDIYHPLFHENGVDIVLQGHNHNYQRTYPLAYNESKAYTPIITDKHTRDYSSDPKGQIFMTVGTGGEDLYNFTSQAPYVITQFLRHGFLNVDVTQNGQNLTATFYENREGKDKDHFSFIKRPK